MEAASFCSSYRLPYTFPLPPIRTVGNLWKLRRFAKYSSSSSINANGHLSASVRGSRSCSKTTSSSSLSSSMRIICGKVQEIKESEFSDVVLKSSTPVLVEFVATWCGPCRLIAPAVESLAQEYDEKLKVVKIDHDSNPRLIEEYKVYGLPTLILFTNGKVVPESRREGAITKVKLKEYVDGLLETVSVS